MEHFIFSLCTAVDLLALVTCLGTLSCRLWVLPPSATGEDTAVLASLRAALWRLLGGCLIALAVSSAGELLGRTLTMSGLPLTMLGHTLPIVLLRTHYGRVWFARLGALVVLWIGWGVGRRHLQVQTILASMLVAGCLIALTRSLSGHAADWGDVTPAVIMDGLHLLAAGLWGGGLLALAYTVLPVVSRYADVRRLLLADLARRFATLASLALAVVLLTGCANAWVQVGSMRALWTTPYGRTLLAKLLLVCLVVLLGAVNHYLYVPLLQQQAGRSVAGSWLWHALDLWHVFPIDWKTPAGSQVARHWRRTVMVESLLLIGVLLCTVCLLHSSPARSAAHATHAHEGRTPTSEVHHKH
jgi:putative copper resistance protein D